MIQGLKSSSLHFFSTKSIFYQYDLSYIFHTNFKTKSAILRRHFINSKPIDYIALTIAIVGTLNWGLIGFLNFNLVHFIFRSVMVDRIIYALVGLSGLYLLSTYGRIKALGEDM